MPRSLRDRWVDNEVTTSYLADEQLLGPNDPAILIA